MSNRAEAVDAWESLYRAQVSVLRHIRSDFPDEVTFTEYDVLFNLARQRDRSLRLRELNRHLLLSQPSVSRMIDRLAARGLVVKSPDPDDARGTLVALTPEGVALFRRVGSEHSRVISERMASSLDERELRDLTRLCNKLRGGEAPE